MYVLYLGERDGGQTAWLYESSERAWGSVCRVADETCKREWMSPHKAGKVEEARKKKQSRERTASSPSHRHNKTFQLAPSRHEESRLYVQTNGDVRGALSP